MKNNKGITLITLSITIFILLLLSSTLILSTRDTYSIIKLQKFISKMKIIQAKVDEVSENDNYEPPEELKMDENKPSFQWEYNRFLDILEKLKEDGALSEEEDLNDYYCFNSDALKQELGLKDIDLTVIINFDTRKVISANGVEVDGKTYYSQYDIDSGEKVIDDN